MAGSTMSISLTPELRATIESRVSSGRYGDASDVVRAGLRALLGEETADIWREWQAAKAACPKIPSLRKPKLMWLNKSALCVWR